MPLPRALLLSLALHALLLITVAANFELSPGESGVPGKKLQIVMEQPRHFLSRDEHVLPESSGSVPSGGLVAKSGRVLNAAQVDISSFQIQTPVPDRRSYEPLDVVRTVGSSVGQHEMPFSAPAETPEPASENIGPDLVDDVRVYRVALASQARHYRVYPLSARDNGIGGRSEIEVVLQPSRAPVMRLAKSSGHDELDQASLEMLRQSMNSVPVPSRLIGQRAKFLLPVEFIPPR